MLELFSPERVEVCLCSSTWNCGSEKTSLSRDLHVEHGGTKQKHLSQTRQLAPRPSAYSTTTVSKT